MQRLNFIVTTLAYFFALSIMVLVGALFHKISPGLAAPSDNGPLICRELMSSGGDDDALIGVFMVFAVPMILRLLLVTRRPGRIEQVIFALCIGLVLFAMFLLTLDCTHLFYSAFLRPDPPLAGALLTFPVSVWLFVKLSRFDR